MDNQNIYIVQGRAEMLDGLWEDSRLSKEEKVNLGYEQCWTCPVTVKPNDTMLIYLMSPISSIVGQAVFTSNPFRMTDIDSEWYGRNMAKFDELKMWEIRLSLKKLKELFPQWIWATRPQGATKVPDIYKKEFLSLIY